MLSGRLAQPERMAIANERIWSFFEFILVSYQYVKVSEVEPIRMVSLIRLSPPAGVIRKVLVVVDVTAPPVSFSILMIFSSAVDDVSGSSTKVAVDVPSRVDLFEVV